MRYCSEKNSTDNLKIENDNNINELLIKVTRLIHKFKYLHKGNHFYKCYTH